MEEMNSKATKRLRVEARFSDKYTGKVYEIGEIAEFESKRADELLKTDLVKFVEEKPKK